MRSTITVLALLAVQLATALPTIQAEIPDALKEPGLFKITHAKYPLLRKPGDNPARSPCPYLNSAANHGLLPYDGKGIKLDWLKTFLLKSGISESGAKPFIDGMDKVIEHAGRNPKEAQSAKYINLNELNVHNIIEHDVSLTRFDIISDQTDVHAAAKADATLLKGFAENSNKLIGRQSTEFPDLTYAAVASWRKARIAQEKKRHDVSYYTTRANVLGSGECALLLEILGNGKLPAAHAKSFLVDETIPDGWQAHSVSQAAFIAAMAKCSAQSALIPSPILGWLSKFDAPKEPKEEAETDSASWVSAAWSKAFGHE